MQLKCPECARTLKIPDTAAGKVVKCPCGKQIRVPAAKPTARPANANSANRATQPAARPANQPVHSAGGNAFGMDEDLFDELTEGDLKPVAVAKIPGAAMTTSAGAQNTLSKASSDLDRSRNENKQREHEGSAKDVRSSIGILLLLGVFRLVIGIILLVHVPGEVERLAASPSFEGKIEGGMDGFATLLRVVYGMYIAIGVGFLACAALIFKYPMVSSITAMVVFLIGEIVGLILNPFALVSIRGWIIRGAIFGGLVQCINNAAYFKFVKQGGRG